MTVKRWQECVDALVGVRMRERERGGYVRFEDYDALAAYADKLAAGLPEGMLPKDVEVLREANASMAARLAEAERLLTKYRFAGDNYPRDGWPDINAFLGITTDSATAIDEVPGDVIVSPVLEHAPGCVSIYVIDGVVSCDCGAWQRHTATVSDVT